MRILKFKTLTKKLKEFDPQKSFVELPAFKFAFLTAAAIAIGVSGLIILNSELTWDFTYNGFNKAVEIFKLPLGILAITIPIIALIATNHRSVQTKEQIKLSEEQNRFSNHFKHTEEFEKYCVTHEETSFHLVKRKRKLHHKLFPASREGKQRISEDSEKEVLALIHQFAEAYSFLRQKIGDWDWTINEKQLKETTAIHHMTRRLKVRFYIEDNPEKNSSKQDLRAGGTHLSRALTIARESTLVVSFIYEIFQFDEKYSPSPLIVEMSNAGLLDKANEHQQLKGMTYILERIDELQKT